MDMASVRARAKGGLAWAIVCAAGLAGCGARTDPGWLDAYRDPGGGDGGGGSAPCAGENCTSACEADLTPALVTTGLKDPYSLASDGTSLFVGQLVEGEALVRVPTIGGGSEPLVQPIDHVEYIVARDGLVFFTSPNTLSSIPASGGDMQKLATGLGPTGFDVTATHIYVAEYLGNRLTAIDRATLEKETLGTSFSGIYRVASTSTHVYFSTFLDGLFRVPLSGGPAEILGEDEGEPRAVLAVGDDIYYTVPQTQRVYRLPKGETKPIQVADLSTWGVFPEELESDSKHLYVTLVVGDEKPGLIMRVPLLGGAPEVIADSQGPQPSALVIDGGCAFWTDRDEGSVFRVRTP